MSDDVLRPRAVPIPSPGAGMPSASQFFGDRPIRTGHVYMTDHTRQQLQAAGWKEGDPVPGDLGLRLRELQEEAIRERQEATLEGSPLAADWKPVVPSIVNITDLPPEKQAEIREYLATYKQQVAEDEAAARIASEADAQIPENIQGPQRDVMRNQILAGDAAMVARERQRQLQQAPPRTESVTIDDRQAVSAAPPGGVPLPEGKVYGGAIGMPGIAGKIEELNRRQQEAEQPAAPSLPQTAELPSTGAVDVRPVHCQRCQWPLDVPFDIEITDADKQAFLAGMLGFKRFEKQYDLLGGNLTVIFRSLSSQETKTLQEQLGAMSRSGAIVSDGEYWAHMHEFRLVMATKEIKLGNNVVYVAPELETWAQQNPPLVPDAPIEPTPLPRMRAHFYAKGATAEPVRRIIGQAHSKFQRLTEAIEFMSDDPNFWTGIGLPA